MAQSRYLGFGLSHLGMKTGQFKPLSRQLERLLKALFHEPSSLNDHFSSVADVVGECMTNGSDKETIKMGGNKKSDILALVTFL